MRYEDLDILTVLVGRRDKVGQTMLLTFQSAEFILGHLHSERGRGAEAKDVE